MWKWSDGSPVGYIDWGVSHQSYPDTSVSSHLKTSSSACIKQLNGIPKLYRGPSSGHHSSAFEIVSDFSYISIFLVNCSARYYSRILCENRTIKNDGMQEESESRYIEEESFCRERESTNLTGKVKYCNSTRAYGRYYVTNSTLYERHHICPTGHNIFIEGTCIKLVQNHVSIWNYDVVNASKSICKQVGIPHEASFDKNIDLGPVYTILDEYYAEGADIITSKKADKNDLYLWLPPALYPTYIPCFTRREPTQETTSSGIMLYKCVDGSVIPSALVCNGRGDCRNAEDERHCSACNCSKFLPEICFNNCLFPTYVCNMFYQCEGGGCVHYDLVCDAFVDCPGGDDESLCYRKKIALYFDKHFIKESYMAGLGDSLSYDLLMCRSNVQYYRSSAICHYDHNGGMMTFCEDGSHLANLSLCQHIECGQHYKCLESYCIPTRKVCDGVTDCPVGDDEARCAEYSCPGHMRCLGFTFCVPPHELCDGISHCPQHEDEKYCQVCPQGCQCKGTAIYCDGVQLLAIIGHLQEPSALYFYDSYPIFEALYSVQFSNMQGVKLLSLQGGTFDRVKRITTSFLSLKVLHLNYQGIFVLDQSYITGPNLVFVNLSHNSIHTIHRNAFDLMRNIKILSLTSNYLQNLESYFCTQLKNLTYLYLSDNPLVNVASDVFLETPRLLVIRSDWYMVCCVAVQAEDCHPQNQFISSCSNLVSPFAQRAITIAQGIVIVIGNIGSIVIQVAFQGNPAERYLMVSLAIADLMMGIYLLAISYIDIFSIKLYQNGQVVILVSYLD